MSDAPTPPGPLRRGRAPRARVPEEARARSAVRGVLALQILANGLGAAVVVLYFRYLFPASGADDLANFDLNVMAFGIYTGAQVVFAVPINALLLRRAVSWVRHGRAPTEKERRLTFSLPTYETLSALVAWIGAAVLFGLINRDVQRISAGIALAGVTTCTLLYLLLEGHFRPVYALALAEADLPADRRDVWPRLMLSWLLGSAVPLLAIGLSPLISPAPLDGDRLVWLALVGALAGGAVMSVAAVSVSRPLNRVRDALRRIEQGETDVWVPVDDLGELGRLAEGVNDLVAGIREREQLRDLFGRQVGQAGLLELALAGDEPVRAGDRREVTVLFVDLRGYTRYAEHHNPEQVVAMLNTFFRVVVAVVNREGGWVNKFEGDAALCLFGAPQDQPDHAARALRAARAIPRELEHSDLLLRAGVGVATGEVIAGFVGTAERFEYTVIGDVVNLASRLCDAAKSEPGGVLASARTVAEARAQAAAGMGVSGKGDPGPGSVEPGREASGSHDGEGIAPSAEDGDGWEPAGRLEIRGRREKAEVYRPAGSGRPRRARWYSTPWSSKAERSAP